MLSYEHERDRRLLIQKKVDELDKFLKQCGPCFLFRRCELLIISPRYMNSSDEEEADDGNPMIPSLKEQAADPPPLAGPRYRPAEPLPAFMMD